MLDLVPGALNWFFGLLSPDQWDALRNWLATIGGLVALIIAANTYRRNVKLKREEQARLVYAELTAVKEHWPGATFPFMHESAIGAASAGEMTFDRDEEGTVVGGLAEGRLIQATVRISNNSKEIIGPLRVQLTYTKREWLKPPGLNVGNIPPESSVELVLIGDNESPAGRFLIRPRLLYRDSSGTWWIRDGIEPIQRVHDDPENPRTGEGGDNADRSWRGITFGDGRRSHAPSTPRVPLRAHWHRLRRKMRGQRPIP